MGDDEELPGKYTLTLPDGSTQETSIGYTGKGSALYANGDKYDGDFAEGQRHGMGVYTYRNGDAYTGVFKNNMREGLARVTYVAGGFYHGFFVNSQREGEGTMKYPNGDVYTGAWRAGAKHGPGTYVYGQTKYQLTGEWDKGSLRAGRWSLTSGAVFTGFFQESKPIGDGVWSFENGTVVEGSYAQDPLPLPAGDPRAAQGMTHEVHCAWSATAVRDAEEVALEQELAALRA